MGTIEIVLILYGIAQIVTGYPQLLFANRKDIRLVNVTKGKPNVTVVVDDLDDAAAIDFIYDQGYVFWTDINLEMIRRSVINNTKQSKGIITSGLVSPDGLACDWVSKKLYWTDAETNRIEVSELDGNNRKVLYWQKHDQPRAIALDPYHGYMFWTDWGEEPKIERAGMDGTLSSRSIIIDDNIFWPNGLTLDYTEWRVYWADAKYNYIHSCSYDGRNRRVVYSKTSDDDPSLPHPFALTMMGDMLYWTDWQTKSIHTCNKTTGVEGKKVLNEIHSPMDIHVFDSQRQIPGYNPCAVNNGGCSHLCLLSPAATVFGEARPNYKCACPTGVRLLPDDKTCKDGAQQMLLLARRTDIRTISLDMPDFTDVVLPLDNIKHSIAIDYDPVEGYVYWTDDEVKEIRRAYLNGTGQETIVKTEVDHPDGVAVDWIGRNIYWTDTGTDRIEVARLNGTSRKILISENLDEPRALCLDPERGEMWWTDWGKEPKIERAYLDGTNRKTIINSDLEWPNGIVVDYKLNKIFWCDAKKDRIELANMDGTGRRILVKDNLPHLFGFSLLGDYIYWTEWQRRSVERVNKNTGLNRTLIIDQLPDLMGLKATNVKAVEGTNACAVNNGGCSHLCLFTPVGAQCACPMGLELVDKGKKCIVPEAFLLFTREAEIKRMSLSSHRTVVVPLKGIEKAVSIDFDRGDNRIYWTDVKTLSISRAFMNGSSVETIIQFGITGPEGISVDWLGHNIYWADSGTNRIEVARLDGSNRRVLIWEDLNHPIALALDPANGYMYWNDWSQDYKIERAWLDGTHRTVIVSNIGRSYGLTIDYVDRRLYWTDIDKKRIKSSDMEGENHTEVLQDPDSQPMALTQYQDFLYWADIRKDSIERVNKSTGSNRTVVQNAVDNVMDILIFHHSRQSGFNGCANQNGGCSNLCLAIPDSGNNTKRSHCACPTHYTLVGNKTCEPPKSFLLFSQKTDISRLLSSDSAADSVPDVVLPIKALRNLKALDYDPVKQHVYWISGKSKSIKRSKIDGKDMATVINYPGIKPFDLAIDAYSHMLFYSCTQNNVINFTHIDTGVGGTVLKGIKPRYLAINPLQGHLYWTNMENPSTIQRSLFDGTEFIALFPSGLSKPGPITVDAKENMLFWADLEDKVIECSDLSGGDRRVLHNGWQPDKVENILGIAVFEKYLYWVDGAAKFIGRINKRNGGSVQVVKSRVQYLSDIHAAVDIDKEELRNHQCFRNNGNCSHLCFIKKPYENAQCSCPNNLVLMSDEKSCAEKTTCSPQQFTCKKEEKCIPNNWVCDGHNDCLDHSDEKNCPVCELKYFPCSYDRECIPEEKVCDGKKDCANNEDEEGCCEKANQVKCARDTMCYDRERRCDGTFDCDDKSDESGCEEAINHSVPNALSPYVIVAIVIGIFSIIIILSLFIACRRKSTDDLLDEREMITLTTVTDTPTQPIKPKRSKKHERFKPLLSPTLTLSETTYDRNHVTGASSSSSAVTQYPKETLNPPPSPVTVKSVCAGDIDYTTNSPSIHSYKKHRRRHHVPPPPTTPCSTDVCEDSEPYFRHNQFFNSSAVELNYDSDPYPPPPTPRSHCFSDDMLSCPDSPTTERSYFHPYPPPPSPVANSDC